MKKTARQPSDTFAVAALLAIAGGFLDAYTYMSRGGVFANAQTGNMVLLALRVSEGRWQEAAAYLAPILAFAVGVLVAEGIRTCNPGQGQFHWRHTVLAVEIAALVAASLVPVGAWNGVVNVTVSFVCALQVEAFRKVQGYPFASTMCTGNLRSGTDALFHGLLTHDRTLLCRSGCYFGVIACFLAGAAMGGLLAVWFPQRAVLAAALFQGIAFVLMWDRRSGMED